MKNTIFIIGIMLFSFSLQAQHDLISRGDSAYSKELYTEAISSYERVLEQGYESAELYYNLGNAYFNINRLPEAILNYERAKLLDPGDEDIEFNLSIANSMIPDKIETVPEIFYVRWWKSLRNSIDLHTWTIISLLAFSVLVLCIGLFFLSRIALLRKLSFWAGLLFVFINIAAFSMAYTRYEIESRQLEAIVFDPTITVKSSPSEAGKDLFVIHEGTKVYILDEINDWCNIRIANGSEGWLPEESLERI
jgi:tetratricopeptide (TPR) repeat protein